MGQVLPVKVLFLYEGGHFTITFFDIDVVDLQLREAEAAVAVHVVQQGIAVIAGAIASEVHGQLAVDVALLGQCHQCLVQVYGSDVLGEADGWGGSAKVCPGGGFEGAAKYAAGEFADLHYFAIGQQFEVEIVHADVIRRQTRQTQFHFTLAAFEHCQWCQQWGEEGRLLFRGFRFAGGGQGKVIALYFHG